MTNDLRQNFHHELDEIRQAVARLAASVTELVPRVTEILLAQDLEGAEYVILGDDEIDSRSIEIEERCLSVLALQAPVASDLRQIVSALKLAPEIERSADLCVNICKAARRIYGHDLDPKLRGVIQKMGEQAQMLFKEATEAYLSQRRRPCRRPRRHGLLPRRPAARVRATDLREPRRRDHRSAGRGAAGGRRPLLRAHR